MSEQSFGDTIKSLREERKLPLREVALKLNIGTSMLGKIEKNTRTPTNNFIEQIATIFNVSPHRLKVAYLSDRVACQLLKEEECAYEVLKAAKHKISLIKSGKID